MKLIHFILMTATVAAATTLLTIPSTAAYEAKKQEPKLTHAQETWVSALEWCESRGVEGAINPKDRDGTPSYYSWQWKPSTFRYYGERYGVVATSTTDAELDKLMRDYATERRVIDAMVLDGKHINWQQQFPDCVKRKVGPPPA